MTSRAGAKTAKRKLPMRRRAERVVLGAAMGVIAFVIEKRVLKGIKEGATEPAPKDDGVDGGMTGGLGPDGLAVSPKQVDQ